MPHRKHLYSLEVGHALRDSALKPDYGIKQLRQDCIAGITVGIIAIPLAMALAIASGVPPQYGLYTAIIAGAIIALTGGSKFSISGPTAAFVVILYPISAQYGLGGLLVASTMSGVILIILALFRLGRLIEYIPSPVTIGFTSGIAIVIATLQLKDFLGLKIEHLPESYLGKIETLFTHLHEINTSSFAIASMTLMIMLLWPRLKLAIPPHIPALIIASIAGLLLNSNGADIETIGSKFSYLLDDGSIGYGIPPFLPEIGLPWNFIDTNGKEFELNLTTCIELLPAAFAIAMLGAIESLLCAVVLDGMSGKKHSANSELLGQGIGNIITPFFGGITATAAIARSATNYKTGAQSPISAIIHSLVVLLALVFLAQLLQYIPMASMAALLIIVAWNMSEAHKAVQIIKEAPRNDIIVFLSCLSLTVLFDMVIAVTSGILLASILFMKEIAAMTKITDITRNHKLIDENPPADWVIYKINGPLFFAAAERVFSEIAYNIEDKSGVVLYLDGVPVLDAGGIAAMREFIDQCQQEGRVIYFADWQVQPLRALQRSGVTPTSAVKFFPTLALALQHLPKTNL